MNSRRKGKEGELALVKKLKEYGYDVRRSQQYAGINGDADVAGIEGLHIECKRCQQVRDEEFIKQAERDARGNEVPVVMYRRNNEQWKVCMRLEDFMKIWKKAEDKDKIGISID